MVDDRYFDTKYLQNGGKGNEIKTTMHIDDTLARNRIHMHMQKIE